LPFLLRYLELNSIILIDNFIPDKEKTTLEPDELRKLYEQAGSCSELARWLDIPQPTLRYRLVKAGIDLKAGYRSPKKVRHYGKDHYNWKGGTYIHSHGYIMEYAPDHPEAEANKGYVMQHRLVMERSLGRYLLPTELVHHVNEDKQDNRLENLEIKSQSEHMQHHKAAGKAPRDGKGRFIK
jgi:hypothetical protein